MAIQTDFLKDYFTLPSAEFMIKYSSLDSPLHLNFKTLALQLLAEGRASLIIDRQWKNNGKDGDGFYLVEVGKNDFEVFASERGMRMQLQRFTTLEEAVAAKFELLIGEINGRIRANQFLKRSKKQ